MQKYYHTFPNDFMGREFSLWTYGHYGKPIFVFPSAAGMAHEWEMEGMVEMLAPLINEGKIKLYCPESNVAATWNNKDAHPAEWIKAHQAYESFIVNHILPWLYHDCESEHIPLMTTGVSMGAFYAVNFTLKYPHLFTECLAMSGRYEVGSFTHGFSNMDIYFNNPLAYLANMEGESLDMVRNNCKFILTCGRGAYEEGCKEETEALGAMMHSKGVPCVLDMWGYDSAHDWDYWKAHFGKHAGAFIR